MAYPVVSTATVNATTTGLTTSFTKVQDKLKIKNNGAGDVTIEVGGLTGLTVHPNDEQEWNIQFTSFKATGVGATRSITYTATETGADVITRSEVTAGKVRSVVALTDAASTATAAQLVAGSIYTMTPTAERALTTATGAQILAALPEYSTGSTFEFTVVNLAANTHAITLTAGASGVTVTGNAVVAAATSATFIGIVVTVEDVSSIEIYRK
jgi:hypothetical protein